ncbi:hypothetical protein E4U21_005867 [Claviceps maximensis]|nr:hypothetical protein E4U21_005867 [Claviceps maximensis]
MAEGILLPGRIRPGFGVDLIPVLSRCYQMAAANPAKPTPQIWRKIDGLTPRWYDFHRRP